jgi:hypothetical protein
VVHDRISDELNRRNPVVEGTVEVLHVAIYDGESVKSVEQIELE